jgi:phosphoribosylglycinamide formyltransferase-1
LKKVNIVVFASGSGTNAEKIFKHFNSHPRISVNGLMTNNPKAKVITRAQNYKVPCVVFNRSDFSNEQYMLDILSNWEIDAIVLAGFLWLIPIFLIDRYPNRIVNIHPALLPKYGGKGMYGMHVHRAVIDANEEESGITIHLVNPEYDKGQIIFQKHCPIDSADTPETLAIKVHQLEHEYYPKVIEQWLLQKDKRI